MTVQEALRTCTIANVRIHKLGCGICDCPVVSGWHPPSLASLSALPTSSCSYH